jgi:hypothetical protein
MVKSLPDSESEEISSEETSDEESEPIEGRSVTIDAEGTTSGIKSSGTTKEESATGGGKSEIGEYADDSSEARKAEKENSPLFIYSGFNNPSFGKGNWIPART